jgi:ABC-type multidrug transport system fused ATPase/permease subunit
MSIFRGVINVVQQVTGGAISQVVTQSSKKQTDLPIEKPNDAFEQFNATHGNAINTLDTFAAFDAKWKAAMSGNKEGKQSLTLVRVLMNVFWKDVLKAAFLKLMWGTFVIFSVAFFVFRLLSYIRFKAKDNEHTTEEKREGYFLSAFFFVSMTVLSVSLQQMSFVSSTLGQKVKAALITAIYRKMLVREGFQSDADVVSLVAKDCPKIAEACTSMQFLWSGIFEAFGIFAVLLSYIGVAALPGLGWLFVALPLQYVLGVWLALKKSTLAKDSKKRIMLMEEILRGMKLIKIYGWESYFKQRVVDHRKNEAASLDLIHTIKSLIFALVFGCPPLFCVLIFGTYEAVADFDSTISFTTLTFFNTLRLPLVKLPKGLRDVLDARLALDRVQAFLLERELDGPGTGRTVDRDGPGATTVDSEKSGADVDITLTSRAGGPDLPVRVQLSEIQVKVVGGDPEPGSESNLKLVVAAKGPGPEVAPAPGTVQMVAADFSYGAGAAPLLRGIGLSLRPGSLLMVAGPVASGKTSLLRAVLGQMTLRAGQRRVGGALSYVPQVPWTALGTVRENILFGRPWDEARYRRVLWACALETDLGLMPDGDLTPIGERGGNLSGGQKQRIALARAAYSGADVHVLDSPLSAVDMHTCQHILRHCVQDLMLARGASVVLATHQTELFPRATSLAVMSKGCIVYSGGCGPPLPRPPFLRLPPMVMCLIQTGSPQRLQSRPDPSMYRAPQGTATCHAGHCPGPSALTPSGGRVRARRRRARGQVQLRPHQGVLPARDRPVRVRAGGRRPGRVRVGRARAGPVHAGRACWTG